MSPRDKVLADAMQLPERERAQIASELLASLEGEGDDEDEDAAHVWRAELERRAREVLSGEADLLDFDDAIDELRVE